VQVGLSWDSVVGQASWKLIGVSELSVRSSSSVSYSINVEIVSSSPSCTVVRVGVVGLSVSWVLQVKSDQVVKREEEGVRVCEPCATAGGPVLGKESSE